MTGGATVVKIGGSTLGSHDTTLDDLATLHQQGRRVVVVHGGGATITAWLAMHGIEARFERGLRVTDEPSLEVVVAVLAGLVNTQLVAGLLCRGVPAVGLSGVDGGTLRASVRDAALGRVGEIDRVDAGVIRALLDTGRVPVVAPVACEDAGGRLTGVALNVNADTAAGHIAAAIGAERLVFLTDVAGILDANGKPLARLSADDASGLIAAGVIAGGMIPKAQAALVAAGAGTATRIIDGREAGALLAALSADGAGTTIGSRGD